MPMANSTTAPIAAIAAHTSSKTNANSALSPITAFLRPFHTRSPAILGHLGKKARSGPVRHRPEIRIRRIRFSIAGAVLKTILILT
jgi:hypothetical protein